MASLSSDAQGNRQIQFVDLDQKRRSIRLGRIPKRAAEQFKLRIEQIDTARRIGVTIDSATAEWLAGLDDQTHDKLARVGLVPPRKAATSQMLGDFLTEYVASRIDVKPATLEVWSQTTRNLREHFGNERELSTIHEGDADGFKLYLMGQGLSSTTVHKRLQFARMFFRAAHRKKLCPLNPFQEVQSKAVVNEDRKHFITRETISRVLDHCPPVWRTIITLCRFGGLRCPSEVLMLKWSDIDWAKKRMTVHSPKTEHHEGGASRVVPLFPEVALELQEAFERAGDGAVCVVEGFSRPRGKTNWRNVNLRTQFERIVTKAGVP